MALPPPASSASPDGPAPCGIEARFRRQQAALLELTRRDAGKAEGRATLQHILEVTARTLEVERVGVWHYRPDRGGLRCLALFDQAAGQHSSGVELAAADYPAYFQALAIDDVIAADDARADPRTAEFRDGYLIPLNITSMLDVPLRSAGRLGGVLCHEHRGAPRHWEPDEQVFAMAVANLVTLAEEEAERRRSEEGLRRARAQLIDAIECLDAGFAMYGPDERLVVCNSRFREMYAAAAAALLPGTRYEDVLRAYCAAASPAPAGLTEEGWVARRLAEFRSAGEPAERLVSGRWVCVADRRTSDGGMVSLRTDITDLKGARETAEAASRAKGEFLAHMSHEVRTPMNGVLGMLDLALSTPVTAEQRDYLQTARSSAEALLAILNDILDFSKIEAGKLDLDPQPFALRDALADLLRPLAARAHAKGLELACRVAPDVPDRVIGDPGRLRQVLTNLVGNAVKFTESGEIQVRLQTGDGRWQTERQRPDNGPFHPPPAICPVQFSVSDTGPGIPADRIRAIFEPFTQATSSTTRRFGGTGLGLTISRRLAELMGGELWAESELGRGSTFHFVARLGLAVEEQPPRLDATRVLVADAGATSRDILVEMLRHWGVNAGQAASWPEALAELARAKAAGAPYRAVLLDAGLTGAASSAEARQALGATAVLLLTRPGADDPPRWPCHAATVPKPVRPSQLFDALQALSGGEPREEAPAAAERPARRWRVLLAEDNPVNQRVAARLLEKQGHAVTVVGTGALALEAVSKGEYDVVLMDVQMPVMDGLEATAELRRREGGTGRRLPVIALTAHAMKGDREKCLQAGMDGYLSKPIGAEDVRRALALLAEADQTGPRAGH